MVEDFGRAVILQVPENLTPDSCLPIVTECGLNRLILPRFELESSRMMKRCACYRKKASRRKRGAVYIVMTPEGKNSKGGCE
jgi:hypothetical protein